MPVIQRREFLAGAVAATVAVIVPPSTSSPFTLNTIDGRDNRLTVEKIRRAMAVLATAEPPLMDGYYFVIPRWQVIESNYGLSPADKLKAARHAYRRFAKNNAKGRP